MLLFITINNNVFDGARYDTASLLLTFVTRYLTVVMIVTKEAHADKIEVGSNACNGNPVTNNDTTNNDTLTFIVSLITLLLLGVTEGNALLNQTVEPTSTDLQWFNYLCTYFPAHINTALFNIPILVHCIFSSYNNVIATQKNK